MSTLVHPVETEIRPQHNDQVSPIIDRMERSANPMKERKQSPLFLPLLIVMIILGVGTGYSLTKVVGATKTSKPALQGSQPTTTTASQIEINKTYGSTDTSTFKDRAEGVLLKGGVNGEGSHHIVRDGGESQTVYLTSSIVDLDLFENHKVEVWGETMKAQRAGWLMDVGQVKPIELNATLPDWAQKAAEKAEKQNND